MPTVRHTGHKENKAKHDETDQDGNEDIADPTEIGRHRFESRQPIEDENKKDHRQCFD